MSCHFYTHYVGLCWLSLRLFGFGNTIVEFYALSFAYHYLSRGFCRLLSN